MSQAVTHNEISFVCVKDFVSYTFLIIQDINLLIRGSSGSLSSGAAVRSHFWLCQVKRTHLCFHHQLTTLICAEPRKKRFLLLKSSLYFSQYCLLFLQITGDTLNTPPRRVLFTNEGTRDWQTGQGDVSSDARRWQFQFTAQSTVTPSPMSKIRGTSGRNGFPSQGGGAQP